MPAFTTSVAVALAFDKAAAAVQRHFNYHRTTMLKDEIAPVLGPDGEPIVQEVDDPLSWQGKGKLEVIRRHTVSEFFRTHAYHVDLFSDPRLPRYRPEVRELGVEVHEGHKGIPTKLVRSERKARAVRV